MMSISIKQWFVVDHLTTFVSHTILFTLSKELLQFDIFSTFDFLRFAEDKAFLSYISDAFLFILFLYGIINLKINDPIEKKRISNCRKLGITPEVPKSKENAKDRNKRSDSIRLKIKRKLNKLNIDINLIPDELPLINDEHFNKAMVCSRSFELSECHIGFYLHYQRNFCNLIYSPHLNFYVLQRTKHFFIYI
jgi:hypothetical protein